MVFLVRGTLTEEDKTAWKRLAAQREWTARKKRRKVVRSWLRNKLCGIGNTVFGALMLYAVISGGMRAVWGVFASVLTVTGPWIFLAAGRCPVWRPFSPPGRDFPPSGMPEGPVKAAFFGDGCFAFWDASGKVRLGYSAIAAAWEDEGRIYLFFRDRPALVLPKRGFAGGPAEDFRDFLEAGQELFINKIKEKNHLSY